MNFVLLSHLWKEYNDYYLLFLKLLHSYHNISSKRIWTKVDDLQVTVLLILLFFFKFTYIGTTTYRSSKQIWTKVDDLTMLFVIFFFIVQRCQYKICMCSGIYRKCIRIIGRFVLIGDSTILLSIEILSVWRSYFQFFFYLNLMNYSFDDSHVEMNYQWGYIYRQALFFYKEVNIRSTSTYGKIRNILL